MNCIGEIKFNYEDLTINLSNYFLRNFGNLESKECFAKLE